MFNLSLQYAYRCPYLDHHGEEECRKSRSNNCSANFEAINSMRKGAFLLNLLVEPERDKGQFTIQTIQFAYIQVQHTTWRRQVSFKMSAAVLHIQKWRVGCKWQNQV